MDVIDLDIAGVKLIKPRRINDARGFFQQTYHYEEYAQAGITQRFVQDNWSRSVKGVLRGLHYQVEQPQSKLVGVVHGAVFDVVVDMRENSPSFGKWLGRELTAENGYQIFIPEGLAHGFQILSDSADFIYKCGGFYVPNDEYGVIWNDPDIGIEWPEEFERIISDKDMAQPSFASARYF